MSGLGRGSRRRDSAQRFWVASSMETVQAQVGWQIDDRAWMLLRVEGRGCVDGTSFCPSNDEGVECGGRMCGPTNGRGGVRRGSAVEK